ncbi:PadR family transcriptional regulator [Bacillus sp. 03113]|uniref:PadR family transcriptional regulator n=1 Tax=Bacillus sp. 03113 TaxID=2578211 RepID=UPI0011426B7F|nr:PadR family transcriptional regulator [Bacillus sp. 03113]
MNIQHVILGFLMEAPMSGYEIKQEMEESVAFFFDASFGAIYPALKRMEKEEFIEKKVIQQEGKPNKNLYIITSKGQQEFQDYMDSPLSPTLIRSDLLIRIFFGKNTGKENVVNWLEVEKEKAQSQWEYLTKIEETHPIMDPFKKMTLNYGLAEAKNRLEWIQNEIEHLTKEENGK